LRTRKIGRPSPAMIVAVVALIMAMAGTGYAALKLPKKSVGTAQLKKNAVTNAKIKNRTITGKKLNLKKLGTVPNATHASVADLANSIPAGTVHLVGGAGEPGFLSGSRNYGTLEGTTLALSPVSFLKDHDNVVHLEGVAKLGTGGPFPGTIFQLPPGFRPASGTLLVLEASNDTFIIAGSNVVLPEVGDISGFVIAEEHEGTPGSENAILTAISFIAGS
jgi:hypothetical protein